MKRFFSFLSLRFLPFSTRACSTGAAIINLTTTSETDSAFMKLPIYSYFKTETKDILNRHKNFYSSIKKPYWSDVLQKFKCHEIMHDLNHNGI